MKTTKDYSSKQENMVASYLGGKTVVASGCRPFHPGDVEYKDFLVECKTHENKEDIIFYKSVWDKICDEAYSKFKNPLYVVDDGSQNLDNTWCLFSLHSIQHYIKEAYPYKLSKNIRFDCKELLDRYRQDFEYYEYEDGYLVYVTDKFTNDTLGLCPLRVFSNVS